MSESGCKQFIQGKISGGTNYQTIAHTANFTDFDRMNAISVRYDKFFREAPYENPQAMAIGVFQQDEELIVVQASHALDQQGCLAKDHHVREFSQSRYIFIPLEAIAQSLQGKTFKLIHRIQKQRIPVLTEVEPDLPPARLLQESPSQEAYLDELQKATEKICLCLSDQTAGKSTLLMTVAALLNQQRIIIDWAPDQTLPPYYLDSILLLLPASFRSQIAFAFGDLDEKSCDWAQLMIKRNGVPKALPADLIWLNCQTHEFIGQTHAEFTHGYVDHVLQHMTSTPEKIVELLQKLDTIQIDRASPTTPLDAEILIHLLPLLSEPQRRVAYETYFSDLSMAQWHRTIPLIEETDQVGLTFAWKQFGAAASNPAQQSQSITLMLAVWQRLDQPNALPLLQRLKDHLPLAQSLLLGGLLQQPNSSEDRLLQQELVTLSQLVVAARAKQSTAAWQLAEKLAQTSCFHNPVDRFNLFDAALMGELQAEELLHRLRQTLTALLPYLSTAQFQKSYLAQQYARKNQSIADSITNLFSDRKALDRLPELADLLGLKGADRDIFYTAFLNIWSPSFDTARQLLIALIQQSRSQNTPFDLPMLRQTCAWFEQQNPELEAVFSQLHTQPQTWQTWEQLATALFKDPLQQVIFLEAQVSEQFFIEVLQRRLHLIENDQQLRKQFVQNNPLWKRLRFEDLSQLSIQSLQFAPLLARCLKEDGQRLTWLKGDLLHSLCQRWIEKKCIEDDLKQLIQTVQVSASWSERDWLELQQVRWTPGIALELPQNRPMLSDGRKGHLFNCARTAIDRCTDFEQAQNLVYDCQAWQLGLNYLEELAMKLVQCCDQPNQTQNLLNSCSTWLLGLSAEKAVLAQAKPVACTVDLIFRYLDLDLSQVHAPENFALVKLLFQMSGLNQTETLQLKSFAVNIFKELIINNEPLMLQKWREQILKLNQTYYQELLIEAINNSVLDCFRQVIVFFEELNRSAMTEEAKIVRAAAFSEFNEIFSLPNSDIN